MKAFINCLEGKQEVDIIDIFKLSGYTFFIHESVLGYRASEWKSGIGMPDTYASIDKAKAAAMERYTKIKKTKLEAIIEISKINYGIANQGDPPTRKQVLEDAKEAKCLQ